MIERLSFNIAVDVTGILGLSFMVLNFLGSAVFQDRKRKQMFTLFLVTCVVMLSDMFACLYRGRPEAQMILYISNTAYFVFSYIMLLAFANYMRLDMEMKPSEGRFGFYFVYITGICMIILSLTNPIHHLLFEIPAQTGLYHRERLFPIITVTSIASILCFQVQILLRKCIPWRRRMHLFWYCVLPIVALIVQHFFYGISLMNLASIVSVLIIFMNNYSQTLSQFSQQEMELQNTRAALVLSQIQPHFLFNSMAAVMDLCDTDPQEAKAALQELSDYLHYKISAMSHSYVVSFREDLDFLNNYLKLEKRRFGSRLNVEYDIQAMDFQIPLLTLQPLVENSIRHGISKKTGGGTIRVRSWENTEYCSILVEDDGVGFDTHQPLDSSGEHVGLSNVRRRLAAMCGGTLTVRSVPGNGTAVEITIKKEKGRQVK